MKKRRLLPLLILGCFSLSACTLFDDSDLVLHNHFNVPQETPEEPDPGAVIVEGVEGKTNANTPDSLCFKNISYATNDSITNTYGSTEFHVNNGEDYYATKSSNNYDLYVPNSASREDEHILLLFIHGGAWVAGFKTDVNPYVYEFANKGYITATIKYTLLKREMNNSSLSIFRDLDEIDACITSIKSVLGQLGFNTAKTKLVIGGFSSGSHLAMLYSYSRGHNAALPLSFVIDTVGPVNIKPESWKAFRDNSDSVLAMGLTKEALAYQNSQGNLTELPVEGEGYNWNEYQTMRIANGMCGIPYSLEEVEQATDADKHDIVNYNAPATAMTKNGGGEDMLSVTYWMEHTSNRFPIICAYAGKDTVVGINQFATLQIALDNVNIQYGYTYFQNCKHQFSEQEDPTNYAKLINQIDTWCSNALNNQPFEVFPL